MGEEAQVAAITGETLYAHYQKLLRTSPIYLYYCGSADISQVESAFRTALAGLPEGERREIPTTLALNAPKGVVRRFSDHLDVTQGKLAMGFRMGGSFRELAAVAQSFLFNVLSCTRWSCHC